MKFFKAIGLSILLCSILTNKVFSQTDTEFWFVVPEVTINNYLPGGANAFFKFSTGPLPATVTISMPANQYNHVTNPTGFQDIVINIPAYSIHQEDLTCWIVTPCSPPPALNVQYTNGTYTDVNQLENKPLNASGINKFGIHITATRPISAYWEVSRQNNKEIWPLKGKNALGTDFYTPFQTHGANLSVIADTPSAIDVVATEDNTEVTFLLPLGISACYGKPMNIVPTGGTLTITLMTGETFSLFPLNKDRSTTTRLRGTRVTSTRPIAITIKDDSFVHSVGGCSDLAGDQLIPTNIIGKEYAIIRSDLNNHDHIYILGTQNATTVTIYNTAGTVIATPTVDAGQQLYYQLPTGQTFYRVTTDKPVYVWHVGGVGCEQGGAILPPIDICTGTTQVAFARTSTETFYIIMMVRKGAEDGFTFNGAVRNDLFPPTSFVSNADFNWSVARFGPFTNSQIPTGVGNFMNNTKDVFHLGIVNGGAASGCYYGYFSDYNELKLNAIVGDSNSSEVNLCYGESTFLHASGGLSYSWSPIIFLDNPNSPHPIVVSPTTTTKYTVTALGACNLTSAADVTVNVSSPLNPSFIADTITGCGNLTVNFTNKSVGNVQRLYWYVKNEGDPDPGTLVKMANINTDPTDNGFAYNFVNTGIEPQNFIVTLLVDAGICRKVVNKSITVYPHIDINPEIFTINNPNGCHPLTVNFRANPIGNYGTTTFNWDFGDGGSSANPDPSHTYTNFTNALAKFAPHLTITDQYNYCTVTKPTAVVNVQPYIKANFTIDKVEGCSPFIADIKNNSIGAISQSIWDTNENGPWYFGSPTNWTFSRVNNGTKPDTVTLRLRVENLGGCYDTFTRDIVIKPQPTADISVNSTDNLNCSPLTVGLQASVVGGINYQWLLDGNEISNNLTRLIQVENNTEIVQQHNITFVTQNQYGCEYISDPRYFVVQPIVKANFTTDKVEGCSPFIANIKNISRGPILHYFWDKDGDGYFESYGEPSEWSYFLESTNSTSKIIDLGLLVYNAGGCSSIARRTITVNSIPKVNLGDDIVICKGEHTILDAGNSGSFFEWSTGETSQKIKVTKTGTYSVTVTNSNDCSSTDDINVLVIDNTTITSQPTSLVSCAGDNATFSVDANGANIKYQWKKDGEPIPSETSPMLIIDNVDKSNGGLYHCTVTGDCGSIDSDIVSLAVLEQPQILYQPIEKSIELGKSASLTVDASGDNLLFKWKKNGIPLTDGSDIQGTLTNTIIVSNAKLSDAGNYTCEISNTCSTVISNIIVIDIIEIPLVNLGEDKSICQDETITLDAGNDGATYLWNNGETTRTIIVSTTGTYSVIVRNSYGYEGSDEINITVHPKPNVTLGDDVQYSSTPLVLDPGPNFSSYQWQDGSTNRTFTVNESGLYSVTVTDINGCNGSDDVYVIWEQIQDIIVSKLLSPVTGCSNDQKQQVIVELQNISKNTYLAGDSVFVYYSLNSKMPIIEEVLFESDFTPNKTMFYSFTNDENFENGLSQITLKTILHGEHSLKNTYYINISPSPYLNFESDTIHSSLPYELVATTNNVSYLWSNGSTNSKITVNSFGEYWLQVTNNYGCTASDTVVILWPVSTEIISGIDATIKLFPNPVKDKLNVLIESEKAYSYTIQVMNPQGMLIRKLKTLPASNISDTIDTEDFTPGMYLVKVSTEKGSAVFKIIVTNN